MHPCTIIALLGLVVAAVAFPAICPETQPTPDSIMKRLKIRQYGCDPELCYECYAELGCSAGTPEW